MCIYAERSLGFTVNKIRGKSNKGLEGMCFGNRTYIRSEFSVIEE